MLLLIRILAGFAGLAALAGTPLYGQFEINPDHFELANTEPFSQPTTSSGREFGTLCFDAKLSLPCTVYSVGSTPSPLGKSWQPGLVSGAVTKQKNWNDFSLGWNKYRRRHGLALMLASGREKAHATAHSSRECGQSRDLALVRVLDCRKAKDNETHEGVNHDRPIKEVQVSF